MIKINLLSPLDKEKLKWEKLNNVAVQGIIWVIIAEMSFVAVFFFTVEYMKVEQGSVSSQLASIRALEDTKKVNKMEADLKDFKGKIDSIYSIQKNHLKWTYLLETLSGLVPDGARLESVSINEFTPETGKVAGKADTAVPADRFKIEIMGRANTRQDLLGLESNLKKSQLVADLQYDDANYVESANINFHYIFYVYRDQLIK